MFLNNKLLFIIIGIIENLMTKVCLTAKVNRFDGTPDRVLRIVRVRHAMQNRHKSVIGEERSQQGRARARVNECARPCVLTRLDILA